MLRSLTLAFLLIGCADVEPSDSTPDTPIVTEPYEPLHACDQAAKDAFDDGSPWAAEEKRTCFEGCDTGEDQGFDQGRLACLTEREPCPDCVATQPDPIYDVGYSECYAQAYIDGYESEGCDPL
ncbi:MAG: hypothetical protein AB8H79_23835 [Myxococcota bacterium]